VNGSFAQLSEWQGFYSAVAGVSATLVGLLFVGLALNPSIMADRSPAGLRTWAGQTFHSFLMVLTIALVALIPDPGPSGFGIPLAIIAGLGLLRLAQDALRVRSDPDPEWHGRQSILRFAFPVAGHAIALWVGLETMFGNGDSVGWLVAAIFLLMMNATANCWDLLKEIGDRQGT
jgi:hypothetical protein